MPGQGFIALLLTWSKACLFTSFSQAFGTAELIDSVNTEISLVGIIQLASVAFPPRRSCLSGLMETAATVHNVDMQIPYVVFFFLAFTYIDSMWSLHGVGRDNFSLQQMPLFAVGNPSTLQNKEGGGSRLAAARLSSPNSGSFLILSAVVSFQFSLPSYFLPWSLCCYL